MKVLFYVPNLLGISMCQTVLHHREQCILDLLVQALGKSAKPIPVLIFGVLLGHRSYPLRKYLIVLLIVVGVALFLYQDNGVNQQDNGKQWRLFHFVGIGELLVVRWRGR